MVLQHRGQKQERTCSSCLQELISRGRGSNYADNDKNPLNYNCDTVYHGRDWAGV